MNINPYEPPQVTDERQAGEEIVIAELHDGEVIGGVHYLLLAGGFFLAATMNGLLRQAADPHLFSYRLWPLAVRALIGGACLGAVALAIWRRQRRELTFPTQFGHWLLLIQGGVLVTQFITAAPFWHSLLADLRDPAAEHHDLHWRIHRLCLWLGCIVTPCLAVYYVRGEVIWRCYAICWALQFSWQAWVSSFRGPEFFEAVRMYSGLGMLLGFFVMLSFLVAAVRDLFWRSQGKDPLHWLGIGCVLALLVIERLGRVIPV